MSQVLPMDWPACPSGGRGDHGHCILTSDTCESQAVRAFLSVFTLQYLFCKSIVYSVPNAGRARWGGWR